MPVKTLGRRAGSGAALRQVKRQLEAKASRSLYASLNLTAMVDFMSVIVIFLLMNFSASGEVLFVQTDIVIPPGTLEASIVRAPVIGISNESMTVEGTEVEKTQRVISAGATYKLEGLEQAMAEQKATFKLTHPNEQFDGKAIIQAHEGVPFKAVRRAVEAAAEVGYTKLMFVTRAVAKDSLK
ncbi:MAG: biopolymer transporter ExbD [Myxococcales bacterium]|nr:biopolymer transporter ExbD [Myxococcales bacterium]